MAAPSRRKVRGDAQMPPPDFDELGIALRSPYGREMADRPYGEADQPEVHRDPVGDEARTRHCWESHLARAQWLSREGYRRILEQAVAAQR